MKLKTKSFAVFLGIWVKLVTLKIKKLYNIEIGTLQWHPPVMTPRPLPQSWSSPHTTLEWHPVMAPSNGTIPTPPKLAITLLPPLYDTIMAMASSNGTYPLPKISHYRPTKAHYNGTQQRHHLQWHPGAMFNPPKWFVALPPIGSKNPFSHRYLGNNKIILNI